MQCKTMADIQYPNPLLHKGFFYNFSVCFLCFYSRVTDNRKNHDSGVQIVERGGSRERVKLYTGNGGVGGEERFPPSFPSKLPPFFLFVNFSPALYYPNARNRLPEESLASRMTQAEITDSANHYGDSSLISQLLKGICVIVFGDWSYFCPLTKWQTTNLTWLVNVVLLNAALFCLKKMFIKRLLHVHICNLAKIDWKQELIEHQERQDAKWSTFSRKTN